MTETKKKLKVLAYMDSPICFSGFAQVARNLLSQLHETGEFEITLFGINHPDLYDDFGRPSESGYPYEMLNAKFMTEEELKKGMKQDFYGRQKLVKFMHENPFDIFFTVQDPFVITEVLPALKKFREEEGRKFRTIFYFPVDSYNIPAKWAGAAHFFDYPIPYTDFGMKELEKVCDENSITKFVKPIPHGTNTKDFFPREDKEKLKSDVFMDKFVVLNVNRNQPRKDITRSMKVFSEFKKKVPNAVFVLHCCPYDIGGNLVNEAKYFGLTVNKDLFFPEELIDPTLQGMDIKDVNDTYNVADILISTSLGEGWGLTTTEAMATKLPIVVPKHTANIEIVGENEERGYLAEAGNNINMWKVVDRVEDEPPRPLTDIDSMVEKMLQIYEDKTCSKDFSQTETGKKVEAAYQYVLENTWEKIFQTRWLPLFREAGKQLLEEEKVEEITK